MNDNIAPTVKAIAVIGAGTMGHGIAQDIAEYLHRELGSETFRPPEVLRRMVSEGKLGKKTGQGFYEWNDEGGDARRAHS